MSAKPKLERVSEDAPVQTPVYVDARPVIPTDASIWLSYVLGTQKERDERKVLDRDVSKERMKRVVAAKVPFLDVMAPENKEPYVKFKSDVLMRSVFGVVQTVKNEGVNPEKLSTKPEKTSVKQEKLSAKAEKPSAEPAKSSVKTEKLSAKSAK